MKNKKIILIITTIVIVVGLAGSFLFYKNGLKAVSTKDEEVIVKIEGGPMQILNRLDEVGLVNNKLCAKIYLKLNRFDNLQANTYIFNKNMSLSDIFEIIENPDFKYILKSKLTIKDGNTIPQVAKDVAALLKIDQKEVINKWADQDYLKTLIKDYWFMDDVILGKDIMYPLEGYLYPETYFITEENPTIESVTKLSLDMMDKKLSAYKDQIKALGWTPHEFLSFVSIVERESSTMDEEKNKIAGVFMNRLKIDMKLQTDASVNYARQIQDIKVSHTDLQIDSPYNTYKYYGLPVGPISSVHDDTMKRCVEYTKHDYLYFFAKKDGTILYNKTYEGHLKDVKENKWY